MIVAVGVNSDGRREVLGMDIGPSEAEPFWTAFLRKLTRQSRTYFVRRYWYGESIREIADSCGAGEEKVKSSLFRTRQRLRIVLEKEGML